MVTDKKQKVKVSASVLSADFSCLDKEIKNVVKAGADEIHLDVMDGHFVQNITFGAPIIKKIRKCTNAVFDTHLMIDNPVKYISDFAKAGSDIITIHTELSDCRKAVSLIKKLNKKAGLAFNPETSIDFLKKNKRVLKDVDRVLVMTVNPGFSGQDFMDMSKKILELKEVIGNYKIDISVDGGINNKTVDKVKNAGANVIVSGSYIFSGAYKTRIKNLKS